MRSLSRFENEILKKILPSRTHNEVADLSFEKEEDEGGQIRVKVAKIEMSREEDREEEDRAEAEEDEGDEVEEWPDKVSLG